jgi:NAD+ kinase
LYINGYKITSVQGDGLIISTPTGSTAYAMAAGASMCHPSVPSIIIAPICPHSLSFRPIVVPAGVELKIQLSSDARNTASFSVDGRANHELNHGYQICVTTSEYPLATLCRNGQLNDWFEGLAICLNWNLRKEQLPLNICYTNHSNNSSSSQLSDKNSSNDN